MTVESTLQRTFEIGHELAERTMRAAPSISTDNIPDLTYKQVTLFFFAKGYKSYQAFKALWDQGFEEDATVLARTIFEIHLQAAHIREDPSRAITFLAHGAVKIYGLYQKAKTQGLDDFVDLIEANDIEYWEKEADKVKDIAPRARENWWADTVEGRGSIQDLAEHHGQLARYSSLYWIQCSFSHSGAHSVTRYLKQEGDSLRILCYPRTPVENWEISMTTLDLLYLADATRDALQLDIDLTGYADELTGIVQEFTGER